MEHGKYKLLNDSLEALNKDVFNLLVCSGDYGMGKSHRISKYVEDNNVEHAYIQSYATPLSFYKILYENRDKKLIIFDDVNSIDNKVIVGLLKSACWGVLNGKRVVEYHSTDKILKEMGLPEDFELKANIVLIFNDKYNGYAPIVNRGVCINFDFTFQEKIAIFKQLQEISELDSEVIQYVEENCSLSTKNLSVRSLVILSRLKNKQFDWKMFSKELLGIDSNKDLLEKILKRHDLVKDAMEEWCGQTGLKERSFYGRLKELKMGRNCAESTELRKNGKLQFLQGFSTILIESSVLCSSQRVG